MLFFLSFSSYAHGQSQPAIQTMQYAPDEVIVKLRSDSTNNSDDTSSRYGKGTSYSASKGNGFVSRAQSQKGVRLKGAFHGMGIYHFGVKAGKSVQDTIDEISSDPDVEYVEPNYIFSKATVGSVIQKFSSAEVSSMAVSGQSYMATGALIQVTDTWPTLTGSDIPVVAVIDTGLDTSHPIIANTSALWRNPAEIADNGIDDDNNGYVDDINGWNFISNSGVMIDDEGHGTHVTGIILGVTQDIYTSYPTAKIRVMPLKFLDGSGYGRTTDAIKAIYYAVNNGATILNNSWGGPSYSAALHEAITYSYNAGVLFVAAAGNSGTNNDSQPMYPSSYTVPNVVSIAATTDSDSLAYFSNYGKSKVHVASPGVYILSSIPGGYGTMSGTSMAAPFVSGLAALMKVEKPSMLPYQIRQIVMDNSDVVISGGNPVLSNKVASQGRINVYNTVQATQAAVVDGQQPAYVYSNQDRQLASSVAASGCGLVTKMIEKNTGSSGLGGGTGAPESWSVLFVVAIMALPILIYNLLRRRERQDSRRQHERYKINSEVKVSFGDRELIGSISTISLGGAQLNTDSLIEQGGIVAMTISSPDGKEQISVEGRVVWSEKQKSYGIQFAETSQTIREKITNWTSSLVKAS